MRRGKRGFTLIEMMVTLFVFSFMLVSAAVTIGSLLRCDRDLQAETQYAQTVSRLASQLRADAHGATSVSQEEQAALRCEMPECIVTYTLEPRRILRVAEQADSRRHQEVFYLGPYITADWQLVGDPPQRIEASLRRRSAYANEQSTPIQATTIQAVVGLRGEGKR